MEMFGAKDPKKSNIGPLIQSIEMSLTKTTITKLADNYRIQLGHIT